MPTNGSSSLRSPWRKKSSPRAPSARPSTQRIYRCVPRRWLLERASWCRRGLGTTSGPMPPSRPSPTGFCASDPCTPRTRRGIRALSAEPDEDEQLLQDPIRETPDESSLVGEGGDDQLSENRRDGRGALGRRQSLEGHPERGGHLRSRGRLDGLSRQGDVGDDEHLRLVTGCPRRHVTEDLGPTLEVDPDFFLRLSKGGREHRRVLVAMASARKADLPGPRIAFAFRPLAQQHLETAGTAAKDDHHGRGRFRLQLRFRELQGEQELPEAFEGSFGHPDAPMASPNIMGFIDRSIMLIYVCLHQHRYAGEDGHPHRGRVCRARRTQEGRREFKRRRPPARPRKQVAPGIRGGL